MSLAGTPNQPFRVLVNAAHSSRIGDITGGSGLGGITGVLCIRLALNFCRMAKCLPPTPAIHETRVLAYSGDQIAANSRSLRQILQLD